MKNSIIVVMFLLMSFVTLSGFAQDIPLILPTGWNDAIFDKIAQGKSLKTVLAVLEFEGQERISSYVEMSLSDMLITSLVKTGKFDIVERNRLEKVFSEQQFQASGLVDKQVAEIGKLSGAEAVIFGVLSGATNQKVDKFAYDLMQVKIDMDIRAVDATTGKILLAEQAKGNAESKIITTADGTVMSGVRNLDALYSEAARDAIEKVGQKIGSLFPLLGFVVNVDGDNITTDIGLERGCKAGDIFIVARKGNEIIHPVSKKHLGWSKTIIGAIEIDSPESGMSSGHIVKKKEEIKVGDIAISYTPK